MNNKNIYPIIEPYEDGWLQVDDIHRIYWQQSGNPHGQPVVVVHGGPGAGINPEHRQYFDPSYYRIIAFDQRGAGRSTPSGELENNTAQHLIEDMEKLRQHFQIQQWLVSGSSWGSTLSLYYAQHYPASCKGLLLRSIFLGRDYELRWTVNDVRAIYPEALEHAINYLAPEKRDNILKGYHELLMDNDPEVHIPAALHYLGFFGKISRMYPLTPEEMTRPGQDGFQYELNFSRIQSHYYLNHMYFHGYNILDNMDKISHLPGHIIHGRYDMCCPIISAFDLSREWKKADFIIVPDAGHSNSEGSFPEAIVKASNAFKEILEQKVA